MNLTAHHLGTFLLTGFDKSICEDFKDAFCDKFDLLEAGSADEAIELLKAQPVDLLIVGQDLPKTNLTKLLEKSSAEFSNVRRLLCSDSLRVDEMNEYLKNGLIHGLISKPVSGCNFNEQIEGMFMPIPSEITSIPSDDPDFASLLKADAEELGHFFDLSPDLFCMMDLMGHFYRVNRAWQETLGYDLQEIVKEKYVSRVHPSDRDETYYSIKRLSETKIPIDFINRYGRRDGSYQSIHWRFVYFSGMIYGSGRDITDNVRIDHDLRESESKYRTMYETMCEGVVYFGSDGMVISANPAALQILDVTLDDIVGRFTIDPRRQAIREDGSSFPPQTYPGIVALKAGVPVNNVIMGIFNPSIDSFRWIEVNAVPLFRDNEENPFQVYTMLCDITKRKKIEIALRYSEERFSLALKAAQEGVWDWNTETNEVFYSYRWKQMLGFAGDEIEPNFDALKSLLHPDDMDRVLKHVDAVLRGERDFEIEFRLRTKEGTYKYILSRGFSVRKETGPVIRIVGTHHDITERKQREEELGRLTRTLKALSDSSRAMIHARDESSYLKEVCDIIVKDCGYAMVWIGIAENDENKSVSPVEHAGFDEGYMENLQITWSDTERGLGPTGTSIRTGKPCLCRNMLTDPQFAPWREEALKRGYASSVALPMNTDEKTIGALSIYSREPDWFSDDEVRLLAKLADDIAHGISAIQIRIARGLAEAAVCRAAVELGRSNKDLEQFAYAASHDLREPLRAVAGFMTILRDEYGNKLDSVGKKYIDKAVEGAERMQTLIDDLLTFSGTGSKECFFAPMQMKDAVDIALNNLHTAIHESNALITCDSMPLINANIIEITQLLQNLIGNAIKFRAQRRPRIHCTAERTHTGWTFGVSDNGIGIDRRYFERIFLIFQKLHTRTKYEGTGIGLALCKKIVERHNGTIWVKSKPGAGSSFFFTIPDKRDI